jgi:hypothetical protein
MDAFKLFITLHIGERRLERLWSFWQGFGCG